MEQATGPDAGSATGASLIWDSCSVDDHLLQADEATPGFKDVWMLLDILASRASKQSTDSPLSATSASNSTSDFSKVWMLCDNNKPMPPPSPAKDDPPSNHVCTPEASSLGSSSMNDIGSSCREARGTCVENPDTSRCSPYSHLVQVWPGDSPRDVANKIEEKICQEINASLPLHVRGKAECWEVPRSKPPPQRTTSVLPPLAAPARLVSHMYSIREQ